MTVILMVDRRRERGARALRSLLEQSCIGQLEVLLIDLAGRQAKPLAGSDHPAVRRVFLPHGTGYGDAKARGVALARAPIVTFFEEHCVAAAGWAEAILKAQDGPFAGVGGEAHDATAGLGMTEFVALMCSDKAAPSFPDMLTALRQEGWRRYLSAPPSPARGPRNSPIPWPDAVLAAA